MAYTENKYPLVGVYFHSFEPVFGYLYPVRAELLVSYLTEAQDYGTNRLTIGVF